MMMPVDFHMFWDLCYNHPILTIRKYFQSLLIPTLPEANKNRLPRTFSLEYKDPQKPRKKRQRFRIPSGVLKHGKVQWDFHGFSMINRPFIILRYGAFLSHRGTSSSHPNFSGIFSLVNHPAMGVPL